MKAVNRSALFGLAASTLVLASAASGKDIFVFDYNCTRPPITRPFSEFRDRVRTNRIAHKPSNVHGRLHVLQRGKTIRLPKKQHIQCPNHTHSSLRARLGTAHRKAVKDRIIHVCVEGGGAGGGGFGGGPGSGPNGGGGGGFGFGGLGGGFHNPFAGFFDEVGGWFEGPSSGGSGGGGGPCFVTGRIRMDDGTECAVEDIQEGDMLRCRFGGVQRVEEVVRTPCRRLWWGWPRHLWPVRIRKDAIAPGVPYEDVIVTGSHALWVLYDGTFHLVTAATLVNGTTIVRERPKGDVFYTYHFRLKRHDVIYANGLPAESYAATVSFAPVLSRTGRWRQPTRMWMLRKGYRKPQDTVDEIHLAFAGV